MKNLMTALLLMVGLAGIAQENAIDRYYTDYKNDKDVTTIEVTGKAFSMLGYLETKDEEADQARKLLEKITAMKVLVKSEITDGVARYREAVKKPGSQFELLMNMKEKDGEFSILIQENNGRVKELLMVGGGKEHFVIVDLIGDIDLKGLSKFTQHLRKEGAGKLNAISENNVAEVRFFPNPVANGSPLNISVPENLVGSEFALFDNQGRQVANERVASTNAAVSLGSLPAGVYFGKLTKGELLIQRKVVVQ